MRAAMLGLLGFVACGSGSDDERVNAILDLPADAAAGEAVYDANCAVCHGADGEGGSGPAMAGIASEGDVDIVETVLEGEGDMPAFDQLSDQEIADLTAFILETF